MSQNNPTTQRNSGRSHECAESADTKDLSTPLREAKWHRVFIPNATLSAALERARAAAAELTQQLASVQEASGQDDEPGSPSQNFQSRIFQGIAYTTSGAKAIIRIDGTSVGSPEATSSLESGTASDGHNATTVVGNVPSPLVDSSHERVPLNTVYELRLWQVVALEGSSECPQLGEVPNDTQSSGSASNRGSGETASNSDASKSANRRDSNGVLAREIRWLNGSGCAEIVVERLREGQEHEATVCKKAKDDGRNKDNGAKTIHQRCWYRVNEYLQHGADISGKHKLDETDIMRSIEVFVEESKFGDEEPESSDKEPKFGNTVFADELMTGRWRKKVGRKMIGTSAAAQQLAAIGKEN
ncbi:hypothetical protein A4H34_03345 [Peptidiphaga gingivicola]|uniref:Uncharacterized protein n=1 Tax=Peptidiphaga gingivicola TaxID=2741497 RepID=A0A179B3F3_9ACTO|nr:hypothetical protein [Peptidiphaga gingivicola]OAP86218.1 hypothetical protein A4H34_03345 [Peptidiphaga gingivicola]